MEERAFHISLKTFLFLFLFIPILILQVLLNPFTESRGKRSDPSDVQKHKSCLVAYHINEYYYRQSWAQVMYKNTSQHWTINTV